MNCKSNNYPRISAALIDMDGTLYNSMPNHARAWKLLMDEAGIPAREEEFYLYEGATGAATIDRLILRTWAATPPRLRSATCTLARPNCSCSNRPCRLCPVRASWWKRSTGAISSPCW